MRRRLLLLGLVTLATMPVAGRAAAQQTDKQRELSEKIEETSRRAQEVRAAALDLRAERARLDAQLGDLQGQIGTAQAALATAQAEVDRLAFESFVLSIDIDTTQRKLDDAEHDAKTSAVLLYKRSDSTSMVSFIVSADGTGGLVEGKQYLERVSEKRRNDLARSQRLRKQLAAQQALLDAQKQQADAVRGGAEATKSRLEALLAEQLAARDAAAQAQASYEATVATLSAQQISLEAEKAAEDARIRELLASVGDGPPMGNGQLIRPVGGPITSGFGYRTDPITGAGGFHAGLDFGASCGTPIKAAGNGTVVAAGWQGGYGNAVIINHGGGMATLYGHQSAVAVGPGQGVTAGQVIGYVGSTGKSTGCHLHFEVRINGDPVDPRLYL